MRKILKTVVPILCITSLILILGCASKTSESYPSTRTVPSVSPAPSIPIAESSNFATDQGTGSIGTSSIERKIVKTGRITLEVDDIVISMDKITAISTDAGGYVVSSNKNGSGENMSGRISIRIPSDKFDATLEKLRKIGVKVPSETTDSRDVTEEYTDLTSRLRNLEATEAQYLVLLNKAATVEDILKVQKELSNVRSQIEQTKGRIQYLDRTSDMSLIEITLSKTSSITQKGWDIVEILKSAVNGLIVFGQILVGLVIWLIIFCPIWIAIWVLVWWLRKKRSKKKA